ncbi:hypothetical protein ABIE51_001429 [Lysobacter sp. OAE881]|uniref:hypothetical protein n=1 Tax=Lysobacter sp. OAE881 TaxID=2663813 RepID=UPI00178AAC35
MSNFYVGQRVRIVRTYVYPQLLGVEAVIRTPLIRGRRNRDGFEWDGYGLSVAAGPLHVENTQIIASPDQLEPILPSGHRSGEYSYTELMDRLKAGEVECV